MTRTPVTEYLKYGMRGALLNYGRVCVCVCGGGGGGGGGGRKEGGDTFTYVTVGKSGTTRPRRKNFFLHLQTPRQADIKLSKFYRRSFSHSKSIFLRRLCMPRCARFSHRRSHIYFKYQYNN